MVIIIGHSILDHKIGHRAVSVVNLDIGFVEHRVLDLVLDFHNFIFIMWILGGIAVHPVLMQIRLLLGSRLQICIRFLSS